jgi:hypothetical protein
VWWQQIRCRLAFALQFDFRMRISNFRKESVTTIGRRIFILLAFNTISFARADVNMKDGSFINTRIDLRIGGVGPAFEIERVYNSRSVSRGAFGFGWSSNFERRLKPRPNGKQKIKTGPRTLNVGYDSRARVVSIVQTGTAATASDPHRSKPLVSLKYVYDGEVLSKVLDHGKVAVLYKYDSVQNLTLIKEGEHYEAQSYDRDLDRVLTRRTKAGCREKYDYRRSSPLHSETGLERNCPGEHTKRLRSHFHYNRQADGQIVLTKTQLISGPRQREIFYDRKNGNVIRVGQNQNTQGEN